MRILQINSVVSYGSTGRISRDLYETLEKFGNECYIAYGRGESVEGYNLIKIGSTFDNYIHFFYSYFFNKHGQFSSISTKKLINKIKEIKPDLIHLHNIHGYFLDYTLLFKYLSETNIPVVWLLHDQWSFSPGPAYFDFDDNFEESIKKIEKNNNDYPRALYRFTMEKNLKRKKDAFTSLKNLTIVTPSDWLNNIAKKSFLGKYNVITIHNGIDTNLFTPIKSSKRVENNLETKKILLAVSNYWESRKGVDFLSRLSYELDNKYVLVIIGQQMKEVKYSDRTILINKTNNVEELIEWYSIADIFINPTLFENFPTVNLEAVSCGCPVITYDTGGSAETLPSGTIGYVVQKGNEEEFKQKIEKLTDDITEIGKEEIIKIQREKISKFEKKKMYQEYVNLYNDILKLEN